MLGSGELEGGGVGTAGGTASTAVSPATCGVAGGAGVVGGGGRDGARRWDLRLFLCFFDFLVDLRAGAAAPLPVAGVASPLASPLSAVEPAGTAGVGAVAGTAAGTAVGATTGAAVAVAAGGLAAGCGGVLPPEDTRAGCPASPWLVRTASSAWLTVSSSPAPAVSVPPGAGAASPFAPPCTTAGAGVADVTSVRDCSAACAAAVASRAWCRCRAAGERNWPKSNSDTEGIAKGVAASPCEAAAGVTLLGVDGAPLVGSLEGTVHTGANLGPAYTGACGGGDDGCEAASEASSSDASPGASASASPCRTPGAAHRSRDEVPASPLLPVSSDRYIWWRNANVFSGFTPCPISTADAARVGEDTWRWAWATAIDTRLLIR